MKRIMSLIAVAVLATSCSSASAVTTVNPQDFVSKIQDAGVVIVDVRTPAEYAQGHVANAINIDVEGGNFEDQIATLDKSATYALYCHSGRRSAIAAEKMSKGGFTSIINLQGGFQDLTQVGAPTA